MRKSLFSSLLGLINNLGLFSGASVGQSPIPSLTKRTTHPRYSRSGVLMTYEGKRSARGSFKQKARKATKAARVRGK